MDFLTHLFLPLSVAYAARPEWFDSPVRFGLAGFGLFPDFDKFLGAPGMLHSLVGVVPVSLVLLGAGRYVDGRRTPWSLAVAFVWSHLALDILDGGPVLLAFPFVETGIGLQYPARAVFGAEPFGLWIRGPLVALRTTAPRAGFHAYGFVNGFGVASMLTFAAIYLGVSRGGRRCA